MTPREETHVRLVRHLITVLDVLDHPGRYGCTWNLGDGDTFDARIGNDLVEIRTDLDEAIAAGAGDSDLCDTLWQAHEALRSLGAFAVDENGEGAEYPDLEQRLHAAIERVSDTDEIQPWQT